MIAGPRYLTGDALELLHALGVRADLDSETNAKIEAVSAKLRGWYASEFERGGDYVSLMGHQRMCMPEPIHYAVGWSSCTG